MPEIMKIKVPRTLLYDIDIMVFKTILNVL